MLQIKNISKQYRTGDLVQTALNNVSLNLRDNEFVSILGPSGSGKTTLLNIIGGLDRYDSGDLIINNISTKNYNDRDWDSYRNHTIGFVFQSYNLIPHQTVLANVELALTIGGISKKEIRKRALAALDAVGLAKQAHKKPNQMSGGQMQRVAIARALVNNPDILLADEPTGALDTETSLQVMELLKKVAEDRLVVMVTHNPELAEQYSTRIVRVKDGNIVGDTNPLVIDEKHVEEPKHENLGKSSMSFLTALALSFNNLLTKKGRTILTAFAGSIGIIGIALILALSNGFQNYIDKIQEDTLSAYPLTIMTEKADMTGAFMSMQSSDELIENGSDKVVEKQVLASMFNNVGANDLKSFSHYLEEHISEYDGLVNNIKYEYNVKPIIYSANTETKVNQLNPSDVMNKAMGDFVMMFGGSDVFNEMLDSQSNVEAQYDLLAGRWPENFNEVIVVLNSPNTISDAVVYGLGLRDGDELENMITSVMKGKVVSEINDPMTLTYDDLLNVKLKLVEASDLYRYNDKYNIYESMTEDFNYMKDVVDNSIDINVVGIVSPKSLDSIALMPGVAYTPELTTYVIEQASKSEMVQKQLANPEVDIFSGKDFGEVNEPIDVNLEEMIGIDAAKLRSAFGVEINETQMNNAIKKHLLEASSNLGDTLTLANNEYKRNLEVFLKGFFDEYLATSADEITGFASLKFDDVRTLTENYFKREDVSLTLDSLAKIYEIPVEDFRASYQETTSLLLEGYIINTTTDKDNPETLINAEMVPDIIDVFMDNVIVESAAAVMGTGMSKAQGMLILNEAMSGLYQDFGAIIASSISVDADTIASSFSFNSNEEELMRLFDSLTSTTQSHTATNNLVSLGYQDVETPSIIYVYLKDFASKEEFKDIIANYNEMVLNDGHEEKAISYTDMTGMLMSSVKMIVDSVSYVLIAFVSISLVVSSIMIGIITYISVLERTKEIGILRAIGASKGNISSIFNAETFIIGGLSGLIGVAISSLACLPINQVIHHVTNNPNVNAALPLGAAIVLIVLSVILTLIGGIIPSRAASKKDPVLALRSE